jgi:predicted AlkP superfamily pyrophosphatase or phosphodiesterase
VALYHQQPDSAAHRYGIDSTEFNQTLKQLDQSFGYLIQRLKDAELYDATNFNLIVVSDHGMVNIRKHVFLDDYFAEGVDGEIWSESTNLIHVNPLIEKDQLVEKLKLMPNVTVILRENVPNYLHYKSNSRIGEVLIAADEGVAIIHMGEKLLRNNKVPPQDPDAKRQAFIRECEKASHGYSQLYANMRGVFMVRGAVFRPGFKLNYGVENVDIYPVLCHVMAIRCEVRNGSLERMRLFFQSSAISLRVEVSRLVLVCFLSIYCSFLL